MGALGVCAKCSGPVTEPGRGVRLCMCVWMSECLMESHEEKHPTFQRGAAFVERCQNQAIFAV